MVERRGFRQAIYRPFSALAHLRMRVALAGTAVLFITAIWVIILLRIDFEYRAEMASILRQNANLTQAFEETVRHEMQAIDDILLFLKTEYEQHGSVTSEMISRMQSTQHIPIVHISIIDERGIIIHSLLPQLLSMNVSDMEYFQAFRQRDYDKPYFAKPVIGRATKKWLFHISRRMNKPDGSMGGAINIGIDPSYFAQFFGQMALGKDYSISIIGKDGFVRVRQTAVTTEVGTDVGNASFFRQLRNNEDGSFVDSTTFDPRRHIYTYRAMPDYPLIMTISIPETEALGEFYQRKVNYLWGACLGSVAVAAIFGLLLWMLKQRVDAEDALHRANEELEQKVASRTAELEVMNQELQKLSVLDGLTGITNRRGFDEYLEREWHNAMRQNQPVSIIMADIDLFKDYNDAYGHQLGDECLKNVAATMCTHIKRATDMVARYGGEEFVVALHDTTTQGGMMIAERLRAAVEALAVKHECSPMGSVTISLGVATAIPAQDNSSLELLKSADHALYEAKSAGRNCCRQL